MNVVGYRLGPLDAVRQGYPRDLFDPETGALLRPAGRQDPDYLPATAVYNLPWTPPTIREKFADTGTIKKDLLDAGRAMFGWLDQGPIGAEWRARRQAGDLTLFDIAAEDLNDLPWELLAQGNLLLFGVNPIARFHTAAPAQRVADGWPLRLWIVNGASGDPMVDAAAEMRRIRADLIHYRHSIDIKIDIPADAPAFEAALVDFQPHVLHFIGHSGVSPISGLPALFVRAANPWELDAATIALALVNSKVTPRLAFLNACHTANRADAYAVAGAFSDAGVPATLTMQGAVQGDEAGKFAAEVYKHLADGNRDLADAVRRARSAFDPGKPHHWAFPVLSLSGSPEGLLPAPPTVIEQRFIDIESCRIFQQVRLFSGRTEERRRLRTAICPITSAGKPRHLVIIVGNSQHGKSHLVKRCLECLTLRGHNTQYVEVADNVTGGKNELDFLLDVFRPSDEGLVIPQLETAFRRFKWDAHQILQRGVATPWDGVTDIPEPLQFAPAELKSENALGLLADAALTALRDAATEEAPLFIVFDQFRHDTGELALSDTVFGKFLWPAFFDRVYRGEVPHLYVGLIFGRDDAEKVYRVQDKVGQEQWMHVDDLPANEFDDLVDELFGYLEPAKLGGMTLVAAGLKQSLGTGKSTTELLKILQSVADSMIAGSAHRVHVGRSR